MDEMNLLLSKWEQILSKLEDNNGTVYPIEIGDKAILQEIEAKEIEVGYELPPSYKNVLQNLGKSVSLYYSFSDDTMVPSEFSEICSGEINWNIDFLQNLNILADELMEDEDNYGKALRGKLEFSHTGNGDIYAFDMSVESEEKPVIYWDHEEDTITYVADSFIDYLYKITELGCIGSEKWQLKYFLDDSGLETTNLAAVRWKNWFESFSETMIDDVKNNMNELIAFVIYRNEVNEEIINCLQKFRKDELLSFLLEELNKKEAYMDQKIICKVIGGVLGVYAESWVTSLWETKEDKLDPGLRSYLTSMCISKEKGLPLVLNFLERRPNFKVTGYEALSHLGEFHSRDVITWMENHVKLPVTEGWEELYFTSNFSWHDLERWTSLEEKHEVTVIHVLEKYVHEKNKDSKYTFGITNLPDKSEFTDFLLKLHDKQVLRKRKLILENILQNINIFY
ncbi:SMI1/KNR4 family protein [Bacillus spongiae]|uniref:SMI1/KNR4 family protein n=1 Tax=Bacillus spongiae TaxID=2683610 RepID=A0ABU8HC17_9BACI